MSDLAKGSLTAIRPVLFNYIAQRSELLERAADLFACIGAGQVVLDTVARVPLREVAGLHADMEARRTIGAAVLLP